MNSWNEPNFNKFLLAFSFPKASNTFVQILYFSGDIMILLELHKWENNKWSRLVTSRTDISYENAEFLLSAF